MSQRKALAIVLAAGEGTRMRSKLPKALNALGGRPLLAHVLLAAQQAGCKDIAVVVGPDHTGVEDLAQAIAPKAQIFRQRDRLGTAHAVLAAKQAMTRGADDVVVMFADTPLVRPETVAQLRAPLARGAAVAVLGFAPADPSGYGRLIVEKGQLSAIVEDRDATEAQRAITLCNAGLMALSGKHALAILQKIDNRNAKREYYLTDAIAIAGSMGLRAVAVETEEDDVRGINTKAQLAAAEAVLQTRLRTI